MTWVSSRGPRRHDWPVTRIVILGCAGAGKSTLARRLSEQTGARLICLDALWRPGWGPDDVPEFRALMTEAHAAESWISDGNFAVATFDIRLPRADLVVWLAPPRRLCAWRAIARTLRPGEPHRPGDLLKVLRFVWNFDRVNRPLIEQLRLRHGRGVPRLTVRTARDRQALLARNFAAETAADSSAAGLAV